MNIRRSLTLAMLFYIMVRADTTLSDINMHSIKIWRNCGRYICIQGYITHLWPHMSRRRCGARHLRQKCCFLISAYKTGPAGQGLTYNRLPDLGQLLHSATDTIAYRCNKQYRFLELTTRCHCKDIFVFAINYAPAEAPESTTGTANLSLNMLLIIAETL